MIYLTYNDLPSGVYYSQVADVCNYLKTLEADVKLVALVSVRGYFKHRKWIKAHYANATVLPMVPKHHNWKKNVFWLKWALGKHKSVMARGPFATHLALQLKQQGKLNKVLMDARGAYAAEFKEYLNTGLIHEDISVVEREALANSDYRIAVSHQLINHWKQEYGLTPNNNFVIPCTLSSNSRNTFYSAEELQEIRAEQGYDPNDIVLVYSGSVAGWQSMEAVDRFLLEQLQQNDRVKMLFLAQVALESLQAYQQFPDRVKKAWLAPEQVHGMLSACDYGILLRNNTVTNQVASPTKFAEYLHAGLSVLISPHIGDYSEFVKNNACGVIIEVDKGTVELHQIDYAKKQELFTLAQSNFTKEALKTTYQTIVSKLS